MRPTMMTAAILAVSCVTLGPRSVRAQAQTPGGVSAPATLAVANMTTGVIGGQVRDTRGVAVAGAHVGVSDAATGRAVNVVTQDDGRFAVDGLTIGHQYTVSVRRIGFAPRTQEVAPAITRDGRTAGMAITLAPIERHGATQGR